MRIYVDFEDKNSSENFLLQDESTVQDLIEFIGSINPNKVTIVLNGKDIDTAELSNIILEDGDRVSILTKKYKSA